MPPLHDLSARTIAQDEASRVVFGMPQEAMALGVVDEGIPITLGVRAILTFDARG